MAEGSKEQEFEELATFLHRRYVQRPARDFVSRHGRGAGPGNLDSAMNGIYSSLRILRFAEDLSADGRDITSVIKTEAVAQSLTIVNRSVHLAQEGLNSRDDGLVEAVEENFETIADGIRPEHFPEHDVIALERAGSPNGREDLQALVYKIKSNRMRRAMREEQLCRALPLASERLQRHRVLIAGEKSTEKTDESRTVKPRTVRGANALGQGALLVITDLIAVAEGISRMLSPSILAVQAVASIVGGLVQVADGVDYLGRE